jgi:hemerythrin superfamily protein
VTEHQNNVVDLLTQQHQEIRRLFSTVDKSTGKKRAEAFDRLRYLLAVHETAEEEIVHPYARRTISNGAQVVEARLHEENQAKQTLQELERIGTDSVGFIPIFTEFRKAVETHAEHEEHEEFPQIAREATPAQLRGMVAAVKAAEAIAPTHPHPGVESPLKNLIAGPFAAVMDRTRDAIRKAMS